MRAPGGQLLAADAAVGRQGFLGADWFFIMFAPLPDVMHPLISLSAVAFAQAEVRHAHRNRLHHAVCTMRRSDERVVWTQLCVGAVGAVEIWSNNQHGASVQELVWVCIVRCIACCCNASQPTNGGSDQIGDQIMQQPAGHQEDRGKSQEVTAKAYPNVC